MYLERTTRVDKGPPRVDGLASTGAPPPPTITAKSHQTWRTTSAGTLTISLAAPGATPRTPPRDGSTVGSPPVLSQISQRSLRHLRDLRFLTALQKVTTGQTTRGVWLSQSLEQPVTNGLMLTSVAGSSVSWETGDGLTTYVGIRTTRSFPGATSRAPRTPKKAGSRAGPSVTSLPVPRTPLPPPAGTGVWGRAGTTEERSRPLAAEPPARSGRRRTLGPGGAVRGESGGTGTTTAATRTRLNRDLGATCRAPKTPTASACKAGNTVPYHTARVKTRGLRIQTCTTVSSCPITPCANTRVQLRSVQRRRNSLGRNERSL